MGAETWLPEVTTWPRKMQTEQLENSAWKAQKMAQCTVAPSKIQMPSNTTGRLIRVVIRVPGQVPRCTESSIRGKGVSQTQLPAPYFVSKPKSRLRVGKPTKSSATVLSRRSTFQLS